MDYFLNGMLNENNTVIEVNVLRRLSAFTELGRQAALVLVDYSPNWFAYSSEQVRESQQIISVFDVIQEAVDMQPRSLKRDGLVVLDNYQRGYRDGMYFYSAGEREVATMRTGRWGRVDNITYFDGTGIRSHEDQYDTRGFLSRRRFYEHDGQTLVGAQLFSPMGEVCLEVSYGGDASKNTKKNVPVLFNLVKEQKLFVTKSELINYLLPRIIKTDNESIVISERRNLDHLLNLVGGEKVARVYNGAVKQGIVYFDSILVRRDEQVVSEKTVLLDEYSRKDVAELATLWQGYLANR